MAEDASQSMLGTLGGIIAPIFAPCGFGYWQAAVALLTGLEPRDQQVHCQYKNPERNVHDHKNSLPI